MGKYRVTTDQGTFEVTTDDGPSPPGISAAPIPGELQGPLKPGFMQSLGKTLTTNSPFNPYNWSGMVSSAFESPFSDQNITEAQRQANLFTGKTKPPPIYSSDVPGMLGEGLGQVINAGLMYGASEMLPSAVEALPRVGSIAKGALKGAGTGATETIPVTLRGHTFNLPAPLVGASGGVAAGHYLPFLHGETASAIGGSLGALHPIVKGAVEGAKQAAKDFDFHQAFINRPAADLSGYGPSVLAPDVAQYGGAATPPPAPTNPTSLPEGVLPAHPPGESPTQLAARMQAERYPSLSGPKTSDIPGGTMGTAVQSGFGPSSKGIVPVEVGGSTITGLPEVPAGLSPAEIEARLNPRYSATAARSEPNMRPSPAQYTAVPVASQSAVNLTSLPEGVSRPRATPRVISPEDLAKVELPDWLRPKTATPVSTRAAITAPKTAYPEGYDPELLDGISRKIMDKPFGELKDPAARAQVLQWAGRPAAIKPLAQPSTNPVAAPVIAPDLTAQVTGGNTFTAPVAQEPLTPIGNNIVYPDNVHLQLHPAGPDVAITHATNASAKDLAVARRLQGAGITPEALDKMPDDELNKHYTALGYKKLGSDYNPGKRVGRDAATGRAHLRQVLGEMQ